MDFDLRHQSESETQNFAVDRVVERVAFLGRIKIYSPFQTFAHNRHDIRERPAQTRNFRDDQCVVSFKSA